MSGCAICKHFACICEIVRLHELGCPFRTAATCAIPVACGHGRDTCPKCDKCTCKSPAAQQQEDRTQNWRARSL
jgi:hypothetical protein